MTTARLWSLMLMLLAASGACKRRGQTPEQQPSPTPPLPPGTLTIRWIDDAVGYAGRDLGVPHRVYCPAGGTPGPVYGAELYSVRSSICTAAVHMRRITLQAGGIVTFYTWGQASRVRPSLRQGIQSMEALRDYSFTFTPYVPRHFELFLTLLGPLPLTARQPVSPHDPLPAGPPIPPPPVVEPPAAVSWRDSAKHWRGMNNTAHAVVCPPMERRGGRVWGDGIYTDDSSICSAALHDGRITFAGGPVTLYIAPGLSHYDGATRNGVRSSSFRTWRGSFRFRWVSPRSQPVIPSTPVPISWHATAEQLRGMVGTEVSFICPPGDLPEPVWGGGEGSPFVDRSTLCTAAVFAGAINFAGGPIRIRIGPRVNVYASGDQNDVATGLTFADPNGSSFTVVR